MVISDIAGNRQFAKVLQLLVTDDYTVLLTVSDEMEYLRSVWFYPNLKKKSNTKSYAFEFVQLCIQKTPKDTKITTFLQIVPGPVNTLNRLQNIIIIS